MLGSYAAVQPYNGQELLSVYRGPSLPSWEQFLGNLLRPGRGTPTAGNRGARRMYVLVVPHVMPLSQATDHVLFLGKRRIGTDAGTPTATGREPHGKPTLTPIFSEPDFMHYPSHTYRPHGLPNERK
jgi:hypothetical protein